MEVRACTHALVDMSDIFTSSTKPIWQHPNPDSTAISTYRRHINKKFSVNLKDSQELQRWTVKYPQLFWIDVYEYTNIQPPLPSGLKIAYDEKLKMSDNPVFFEGHRLNYAENALNGNPDPNAVALIGLREGEDLNGDAGEKVTRSQLRDRVRVVASALRRSGIKEGDRVAALVSCSIPAFVLFLATASLGAIFTCVSPDLGIEGCVSRFVQVTPRILFCDGDITYKGKRNSTIAKIDAIMGQLKVKPLLYVIPIALQQSKYPNMNDFLSKSSDTDDLTFNRVPFNQPLMICYSSGTTGAPKCIVHAHGLLLNLRKTSGVTNGIGPADVVLQYTSTSWVMFYITNGHLAAGATTIAYDGSPMFPDVRQLIRILEKFKVSYFGSSPRYLAELEQRGVRPGYEFNLEKLRMVNTTGAPLSTDQYHWFYASFPPSVQLNNSAGGTDSATTFIGSDSAGPLYPGEMQTSVLGIDSDVADPVTGESIAHTGEPGELVIRKPFPSMPAFFWGDKGGKIYKAAYFERFENVDCWAQHDWVAKNPKTQGWVMTGRSDGVLNPSGIRFGSGEIYAITEGPDFNSEIAETLCVGRRRPHDRDEEVFLFVRMNESNAFTEQLKQRLRKKIADGLSPRHVPRFIIEVKEIPTTINGKKVEIAVKSILSGKDVKASSTVANPGSLEQFKQFRTLEAEARQSKL